MKERWFADDRDLVKWSALLHFARAHALTRIIQVAYARADARPQVTIGEQIVAVDDAVWTFFRDLQRIRHLGVAVGIPIEVIDDTFDPKNRAAYQQRMVDALGSNRDGAVLLFLDPDTGLQISLAAAALTMYTFRGLSNGVLSLTALTTIAVLASLVLFRRDG